MESDSTTRPQKNISDCLKGHIPSLNGWRALSIILVLMAHSVESSGFPQSMRPVSQYLTGELGVQIFFGISGFLITWLLLREHDTTGRIALRAFYERRMLRILPVYFAFVGVMAVFQYTTSYNGTTAQWIRALTFTANYAPAPPAMSHLWSLSVEEQFYLLWPWMVVLGIARVGGWRGLKTVLYLALCAAPAFRVLGKFYDTPLLGYLSFLTTFDLLGWGCLFAILLHSHPQWFEQLCAKHAMALTGTALALIFLPLLLMQNNLLGIITLPFRFTFTGIGVCTLLTISIFNHDRGFWRLLNHQFVSWLGILSYSIYIWHRPFSVPPALFGMESAWWMEFPTLLLASLAVATVSYYALERPLMALRKRLHSK